MSGARVRVAAVADVPPGEGRVVEAGGRVLALFNVEGRFYAVDNACLHRGGPLGEGELDGPVVTCPWHGWRWDVRTGVSVDDPALRLACFPVVEVQGELYVDLGAA